MPPVRVKIEHDLPRLPLYDCSYVCRCNESAVYLTGEEKEGDKGDFPVMRKSPSKFETHDDGARWTTSGRVTLDSFFGFWEIDLLGPDNCVGPDGEAHTRGFTAVR